MALAEVAIAAFNSGDIESLVELLDPDIEVYAALGLINSGTYRGRDGFRAWLAEWLDAWDSSRSRSTRSNRSTSASRSQP